MTSRRWAALSGGLGFALVAAAPLMFVLPASASASGCGPLPPGDAVYLDCQVPSASAPYATFGDGQQVDLAMGANSVLSGGATGRDIVAIECEYSTGTGPGDPPDTSFCDAQTLAGGFPYSVHANGSFDYQADQRGESVTLFALPDATLSGATIKCDATHPCVWYVGQDYNHFTAPHVWSNPFVVTSSAAVTTTTTAVDDLPLVTGSQGSGASVTGQSPGGQLAYTGPPPLALWVGGIGVLLAVSGRVARRALLRGSR